MTVKKWSSWPRSATHNWNISYAFCVYSTKLCLQCYQSYHLFLRMQQVFSPERLLPFTVTAAKVWFGQVNELLPASFFLDAWRRSRSVRSGGRHLESFCSFSSSLAPVTSRSWWCTVKHTGSPRGGAGWYICLEKHICDVWRSAEELQREHQPKLVCFICIRSKWLHYADKNVDGINELFIIRAASHDYFQYWLICHLLSRFIV